MRAGVVYLEEEVPKWKRANGCRSCHNDGDGLRALVAARRGGVAVKAAVLTESLKALRDPDAWEAKPLARLQLAAAAREAVAAKLAEPAVLAAAAAAVAGDQDGDGHWKVEEELAVGSPVTYGPVLATWMAREVLRDADEKRYGAAIQRATQWFAARVTGAGAPVLDLAAMVLALERPDDRERLAAAQLGNGSWNNEVFDTAVAMLALRKSANSGSGIRRARVWLAERQLPGGGWPGTTRPAGGESYAQHLSTTAWAVMALAATEVGQQR